MRINQIATAATNRYLTKATESMNKTAEKIASGKRILTANDDVVGVVTSNGLKTKLNGLKSSEKDIQDKKDLLKTADKTLNNVMDLAQKISDAFTEQSSFADDSDEYANLESTIKEYSAQITNILTNTKYNGKELFGTELTSMKTGETAADKLSLDLGKFTVAATMSDDTAATTTNATEYKLSFETAENTTKSIAKLAKAYAKIGVYEDISDTALAINQTSQDQLSEKLSRIVDVDETEAALEYNKQSILQTNAQAILSKQSSGMSSIVNLLA